MSRYVILSFIFFYSCSFSEKSGKVRESFETLQEGKERFETFYPNGQKKRVVELIDSVPEGREIGYYSSGEVKYNAFNKKGVKDSTCVFYYPEGSIKAIYHYYKGKLFGDQYTYDSFGALESYYFNNYEEVTLFLRKYSDSLIIQDEGIPFYAISNRNHLAASETFEAIVYFAVPPFCKYNIVAEELKDNKLQEDSIGGVTKKITNSHIFYIEKKCDRIGSYQWKITLKLTDTLSKKEINKTLNVDCTVSSQLPQKDN